MAPGLDGDRPRLHGWINPRLGDKQRDGRDLGLENTRIAILLLIFSLTFHYFSYAFTSVGADYELFDISLSRDDLMNAGILLGEYDTENLTFAAAWTVYDMNTTDVLRARWYNLPLSGDALRIQKRYNIFGVAYWRFMKFRDHGPRILNSTIITDWEPAFNWTRESLLLGYEVFIQDPSGENNITKAVLETGELEVTIARNLYEQSQPNVQSFLNWYASLVTGSNEYGLPPELSILVQIITLLGIFSLVLLIKEMLSF